VLANRRREDEAMDRFDAKTVVVALLLVVVAIGALAEVGAGRAVIQSKPPRAMTWQVLVQSGDAARVRGDVAGARRAYMAALMRARGEGSVAGVLRAAEGFRALGDHDVVERALRMAAVPGPGQERGGDDARLQALRDRLDATDALPLEVGTRR
jgi:hypothetical protein